MAADPVALRYTGRFLEQLARLEKKYRHIRDDLDPLLLQLREGGIPGDRIPGAGMNLCKVRLPNRDARKGKRGGYRVIYYLQTRRSVILLTIYAKSEMQDVSAREIREILREFTDQP